jgi:Flp pilus assembly protein CpaB
MKFAVICLCLLGIAAAACAAFLVNGLNATSIPSRTITSKADENVEVGVLYVTRAVPAMTVVDGGMVMSKPMPRSQAPAGYLTSSMDVVGKVVAKPLVAGEPFTKESFAEMTGPRQLAGVIPNGKRAVGISVTDYAGLEGLIYPGSIVDVMVSFKADGALETRREAVTTTLVENVQVLAFEQQTVVSPGKTITDIDTARAGSSRRVTLLVDTKQSKALELAMQQGTLSLALRNPLDSGSGDKEAVSVHSLMGEEPPIGARIPGPDMGKAWETALRAAMTAFHGSDSDKPAPATQPTTQPAAPAAPIVQAPPPAPHWDTIVIRGEQVETRSFPLPAPLKQKLSSGKEATTPLSAKTFNPN